MRSPCRGFSALIDTQLAEPMQRRMLHRFFVFRRRRIREWLNAEAKPAMDRLVHLDHAISACAATPESAAVRADHRADAWHDPATNVVQRLLRSLAISVDLKKFGATCLRRLLSGSGADLQASPGQSESVHCGQVLLSQSKHQSVPESDAKVWWQCQQLLCLHASRTGSPRKEMEAEVGPKLRTQGMPTYQSQPDRSPVPSAQNPYYQRYYHSPR